MEQRRDDWLQAEQVGSSESLLRYGQRTTAGGSYGNGNGNKRRVAGAAERQWRQEDGVGRGSSKKQQGDAGRTWGIVEVGVVDGAVGVGTEVDRRSWRAAVIVTIDDLGSD